ncbi:MAG TPA: NAD-dependent epimerase/dehydratase family protein [Acidimicrobiia bacterium]
MSRAVVTGCAGFIGSHLTERLLSDGWSVIGIDCLAPTYDTTRRRQLVDRISNDRDFEFIEGNINGVDLRPLLEGADVVFHLAARPGVRASWGDFRQASEANILATQRVLDALIDNPGARLVFASSSSVYGRAESFPTKEDTPLAPISPYGVTKAACEALVGAYAAQADLNVASLRYFTVYGPRQRSDMAFTKWIGHALRSRPLHVYGDGSAIRDFTYVDDVVEATIACAICEIDGHETFNVAGGSPARLTEVLGLLEELVGTSIKVEYVDRERGDPPRTGGDTSKLFASTGWTPTWTLEKGLAVQVAWLRDALGLSPVMP